MDNVVSRFLWPLIVLVIKRFESTGVVVELFSRHEQQMLFYSLKNTRRLVSLIVKRRCRFL